MELLIFGLALRSESDRNTPGTVNQKDKTMPGSWFGRLRALWQRRELPLHLRYGELGEQAAKRRLKRLGLKFLTANFRSPRGEIDLVCRDKDCLVFVEVKTRSSEEWSRPASAVDAHRRRRLTRAALDYLHLLKNPRVKVRFDIVEVVLRDGTVGEIRHLPNSFAMERPYRYD